MSIDATFTRTLMTALEDGRAGYDRAADLLADSERADLAPALRQYGAQRVKFAAELRAITQRRGDSHDDTGSAEAAIHRAWMSAKDALTGSDAAAVLAAAGRRETSAISTYEAALRQADELMPELRTAARRQLGEIRAALAWLKEQQPHR